MTPSEAATHCPVHLDPQWPFWMDPVPPALSPGPAPVCAQTQMAGCLAQAHPACTGTGISAKIHVDVGFRLIFVFLVVFFKKEMNPHLKSSSEMKLRFRAF